jgi:hypothetical protein
MVGAKIFLLLPGASRRTIRILGGARFRRQRRLPDVPRHPGIVHVRPGPINLFNQEHAAQP